MKKLIFKYILNILLTVYSFLLFITNINYSNKLFILISFFVFLYFFIKFIILNFFIIKKDKLWIKIDIYFNLILYFIFLGFGIYLISFSKSDYIPVGYTIFFGNLVIIFYNFYKLYKNNFSLSIFHNFQKQKFIKYNLIIVGILSILLFFYTNHKTFDIPKNYFDEIIYDENHESIEKIKYFDESKYFKVRNKIDYNNLFDSINYLTDEDIDYLKNFYEKTKGSLNLENNKNYEYSKLNSLSNSYKILANYYYINSEKQKTIDIYKDLINKSFELKYGYHNFMKIFIFNTIQKGIILELEKNNFDENTNSKIVKSLENINPKELFKFGIIGEYNGQIYYLDNIFANIPLIFNTKLINNILSYKYYYAIENEGKKYEYKISHFKSNFIGYYLLLNNLPDHEDNYKNLINLENSIKKLKEIYK